MAVEGVLTTEGMTAAGNTDVAGGRALSLEAARARSPQTAHGAAARAGDERGHVGAPVAFAGRGRRLGQAAGGARRVWEARKEGSWQIIGA